MTENHLGKVVDGRYRLDRLLGEGASGAVYAATQLSVDRTVAVKLLHSNDSPGFGERFQREARAIGKLNHTNVITLHDFGFDDELGAHFMVTEFADGVPLSERMKDVMSTELSLKVALEVASALHHAHAQGILHRDLKPENVMLTRADGRVDVAKVLDFGLAEVFDPKKKAPDLIELSSDRMDPFAAPDDPAEDEQEAEQEPQEEAKSSVEAATAAAKERVGEQEEGADTAILPPIDLSEDRDPEVQREIDAQFGGADDSSAESGEKE